MSQELQQSLDMILEISQETLLDHMKSLYDMYGKYGKHITNPSFSVNIYKPLVSTIMNYYNSMFKSLILGNDIELNNKFKKIRAYCDHKEICLVNLIFQLTLSFLHSVLENHHKFNKNTCKEHKHDE